MTTPNIRLACSACNRDDKDLITLEHLEQCKTEGWTDINEIQSFEESCRIYDNPTDAPKGYDVTAWYTHLGVCPDCQEEA
jgi:hypothetical protein